MCVRVIRRGGQEGCEREKRKETVVVVLETQGNKEIRIKTENENNDIIKKGK